MHKPLNFPGAKAIYSRHTLQHHQFFTEQEMRFAGTHDWRVTLFPPYALAIFIAVLSAPAVIILSLIRSSSEYKRNIPTDLEGLTKPYFSYFLNV